MRATQKLVDQMGWVFGRPSLTALEVAWRWVFGAPLLWVLWRQALEISAVLPPASTGLTEIDKQNPWVAAVQLADVWVRYEPFVAHALAWLAPIAICAWIFISGIGRNLVFRRLEPRAPFRPIAMTVLQAAGLFIIFVVFLGWFYSMQWVAATHIAENGEADLIGYSIWAIFLSLGFFTLSAVVSWPFAVAPLLMIFERRSPIAALVESFRLGREFTAKLLEINLVMGIVKLALIVLAMVFSVAPLPFSA